MATSYTIRVEGPTSSRTYRSLRAAARSLSGNGTDSTERTRSRIRRALNNGGGFVRRSYVVYA